MLEIDETSYERSHFDARYEALATYPGLERCAGRRYAACLTEPAEWIALCLYLRERGGSVLPLNPNTPLEAAKRLARRTRCEQLLFHSVENAIPLGEAAAGGAGSLLQLSSGTTGEPKCIERPWPAIDEEIESYCGALGEHGERTPLLACPITHAYGLISGVLAALRRGVRPVVLTNINPKYLIRRATESPRGLLYASPTLLNVLVRLLPEDRRLCAVMTSGAPLRASEFVELQRRAERVLQQYGCSEVGCISLNRDMRAANEIGTPLSHLRVRAGASREEPEEIRVGTRDAEVGTKDLGYVDERGLHFVARMDDMINVAGVNVYPQEVEEVVLEFPGVQEAVVYKRVDPYASERVCLQFTGRGDIDVAELRRFCAENLTPFAVPTELRQVAEIAKLENGKINRGRLADLSSAGERAEAGARAVRGAER